MDFINNIIGGVTETLQLKMVLDWLTANGAGIGGLLLVGIGLPFTLRQLNKSNKVSWKWALRGPTTFLATFIWFIIVILVGFMIVKS